MPTPLAAVLVAVSGMGCGAPQASGDAVPVRGPADTIQARAPAGTNPARAPADPNPAPADPLPPRAPADTAPVWREVGPVVEIHFLDVGQGDATLIRAPSGQVVLIDAGPAHTGDAPGIGDHLRRLAVDRIDLLIVSHNHADHIGGVPEVLAALPVRFFMDNGIPHTTATYRRMLEALVEADVSLLEPERRTIELGGAELEVLPPPGDEALGHNDNSLGVVLRYGDFRATFAGDAEAALWRYWLREFPQDLEPVKVHKASHHGSRNGDTPEAMERLRPRLVVVSAGRGNRYGHPHAEALAHYRAVGARVLTTAKEGSVTVLSTAEGKWFLDGWTLDGFPDYHSLSQGFMRFTERIHR